MNATSLAHSARYRALIQLLRTAEDLWNASRVFFAPWDLSPSQFNVLNVLYGHPDGLSQSDLSRVLIMHRSNVTGLIDRLERRGLVQRAAHDSDRRAYRLLLTPEGLDLIQRILPVYHRAAEAVWAETDDPQAESLLVQLQAVAGNALAVAHLNAASMQAQETPRRMPSPTPAPATALPVDPVSGAEHASPPPTSPRPRRASAPRPTPRTEDLPPPAEDSLRTSDL